MEHLLHGNTRLYGVDAPGY